MSANFAGAVDDDPLEKSYEEMAGGWDKSAAPMPLKIDRRAEHPRQREPRAVPGVRRVGLHVRRVHSRDRRRQRSHASRSHSAGEGG